MLKYIKFTRYSYVHHSWMKWKCNVSQANTRSLITINDSSFSLYMIIIIIKVPSFDDISHFPYTTNLIYNTDDFLKKNYFTNPKIFINWIDNTTDKCVYQSKSVLPIKPSIELETRISKKSDAYVYTDSVLVQGRAPSMVD